MASARDSRNSGRSVGLRPGLLTRRAEPLLGPAHTPARFLRSLPWRTSYRGVYVFSESSIIHHVSWRVGLLPNNEALFLLLMIVTASHGLVHCAMRSCHSVSILSTCPVNRISAFQMVVCRRSCFLCRTGASVIQISIYITLASRGFMSTCFRLRPHPLPGVQYSKILPSMRWDDFHPRLRFSHPEACRTLAASGRSMVPGMRSIRRTDPRRLKPRWRSILPQTSSSQYRGQLIRGKYPPMPTRSPVPGSSHAARSPALSLFLHSTLISHMPPHPSFCLPRMPARSIR
ncbi:hypothetical protein BC834DRAFT_524150 [Gloeopeniophorella convolvens]|nr:hypothetical protein BC834DRAFT_524150 [Gloeopeniophorella convolvens]